MSNENSTEFPFDFRPSPSGRFEALRAAFEASENAISHQADQLAVREQASRRRHGTVGAIYLPDLAVLHMEAEETFAKVFRGGFLLSIWAVFESCVRDLGEYVRRRRDLPFGLKDRGDLLKEADKFFGSAVEIVPFPDEADRKQLELLRTLRNVLVHHDGSPNKALVESLGAKVTRVVDYHHEYLTPSAQYNSESLDLAARVSEALAKNVYSVLDPRTNA